MPSSESRIVPAAEAAQTSSAAGAMPLVWLRKAFSFPVFLAVVLVAGALGNQLMRLDYDEALPLGHWHTIFAEGDTYWHIAVGQRILDTHRWPTTNFYSFTTPQSQWRAYQWLGEVAMATASRLGGARGLMMLLWALVSAILLLVYYSAIIASGNPKAAFAATAVVLPLLGSSFSVRPQLVGYVCLILTLICLERYRRGKQASLWVLPPLFIFWANSHATFMFGWVAVACYGLAGLQEFRWGPIEGKAWLAPARRHVAVVFALSVGAVFVNPYGWHLLPYALGFASHSAILTYTEEWQPLGFHGVFGICFLLLLVAFGARLVWVRRPMRVETVALALLAATLTVRHQRVMVFFALVIAPVAAELFAELFPAYEPDKNMPVLNAALIGVFIAGMVLLFPSATRLQNLIDHNQPRRALDYLRTHPVPGPMLNDPFWGGYLIWASGGQRKVFIDGRSEAYDSSGVFTDYHLAINRPDLDAQALLDKYGVQSCLVERGGSLGVWLNEQPAWHKAYEDDLSALFVHKPDLAPSPKVNR